MHTHICTILRLNFFEGETFNTYELNYQNFHTCIYVYMIHTCMHTYAYNCENIQTHAMHILQNLTRNNTHLICMNNETPKAQYAVQWGVKVVNHLWLTDSIMMWNVSLYVLCMCMFSVCAMQSRSSLAVWWCNHMEEMYTHHLLVVSSHWILYCCIIVYELYILLMLTIHILDVCSCWILYCHIMVYEHSATIYTFNINYTYIRRV